MLSSLSKFKDLGLLILRIGVGIMFILHGQPKLFGGPETWVKLGGAMSNLGITFLPVVWGFLAAIAEFGGGICILIGFAFRPAAALLAFTMFVAAFMHYNAGDAFIPKVSYPLELCFVFFGLIFIGPGAFSADRH